MPDFIITVLVVFFCLFALGAMCLAFKEIIDAVKISSFRSYTYDENLKIVIKE